MRPTQLEQVLAQNRDRLEARGMVLHGATKSDIARAIKLPSVSNGDEPTYYSRISRDQEQHHA
ncbi:MAG: hypothetical protein H0X37_21295 [Herpetosiphonaceae bacterium]|nr:hypothetical protein [Herpetosiphonaceae bacterium]